MRVTHSFEAVRSHQHFRITARASDAGNFCPYLELLVEDTESRSSLRLKRSELMPLLGAVKEALKEVEDAVAGLPSDPVERASLRIPHHGMATSMYRAHILNAYRAEMADLRLRYVQQFDDLTSQGQNRAPG